MMKITKLCIMLSTRSRYYLTTLLAGLGTVSLHAQIASTAVTGKKQNHQQVDAGRSMSLNHSFKCFSDVEETACYSIRLCADIPDNENPSRMLWDNEPGHVFLIFTKKTGNDSTNIIFGYYPRKPFLSFLLLRVKSTIHDNSNREYDVSITREVTATEFSMLMEKAEKLSHRKYHLKKFNCYDYALEVFNSIPRIEKIPVKPSRFSFLLGKFGSPCGLYFDLQMMVQNNSAWSPSISFVRSQAPPGCKM
jgi:hypothetical protein